MTLWLHNHDPRSLVTGSQDHDGVITGSHNLFLVKHITMSWWSCALGTTLLYLWYITCWDQDHHVTVKLHLLNHDPDPHVTCTPRSHDLTNVIYRGVAGKEKGGQQPLLLTSISSINVIGKSNFSDRGSWFTNYKLKGYHVTGSRDLIHGLWHANPFNLHIMYHVDKGYYPTLET